MACGLAAGQTYRDVLRAQIPPGFRRYKRWKAASAVPARIRWMLRNVSTKSALPEARFDSAGKFRDDGLAVEFRACRNFFSLEAMSVRGRRRRNIMAAVPGLAREFRPVPAFPARSITSNPPSRRKVRTAGVPVAVAPCWWCSFADRQSPLRGRDRLSKPRQRTA